MVFLSTSLLLCACQGTGGRGAGSARVPVGEATARAAAEKFFVAYKTHNRSAAEEVATDAAINELNWDPSSGDNPTLQLIDDTHIYYEGGSIQMDIVRNPSGRWYVRAVTLRAD